MAGKRWYTPSPEQEAVAAALFETREARKISQAKAAKDCGLRAPQLSEMETGTRPVAEDELLALLRLYKVEPQEARRLNGLREISVDTKTEWFAPYCQVTDSRPEKDLPSEDLQYVMRAEECAEKIFASQEQYIPGLLQTTGYATELIKSFGHTGTKLQESVEIRIGRQKAFFRPKRHGIRFHAIISESVLRKGPRDVLAAQLDHLLKMQRDGRIECRIIPESVLVYMLGFALMDFSFGRSIGYADGGLNELYVARMRSSRELDDMRDRYSLYSGMALTPDESAHMIEKYRKGL